MKKAVRNTLIVLLALCMSVLLVCCKKNDTPNGDDGQEEIRLKISQEDVYLSVFDSIRLEVSGVEGQVAWVSGDPEIASVSDTGVVNGLKEGNTVITATVGEYSATCRVMVLAGSSVPNITVNEKEISLFVNYTYSLKCGIIYKGENYTDGTFTFRSLDEQVATVDANGKITGVGLGETKIEISANWRSYTDSVYLKELIDVSVKPNIALSAGTGKLVMSKFAISAYGKDYPTEKTLEITATHDGAPISDDELTLEIGDENIVSAEGYTLTAKNIGETTVALKYTLDGKDYYSDALTVSVERPVIDVTHKNPIYLDMSEDTVQSEKIDNAFAFNNDGKQIVKITDEISGAQIGYDSTTKALTKNDLVVGERVFLIGNDDYDVRLNVTVATKIIETEQEFIDLQTYGNVTAVSKNGLTMNLDELTDASKGYFTYGGYFVLANDLDFTDVSYGTHGAQTNTLFRYCNSMGSTADQNSAAGFRGTFDGLGHTIKNIKLNYCGLFGTISKEGVVKNLKVNADLYKWANGKNAARSMCTIAQNLFGTLENVQIDVSQNETFQSSAVAILLNNATLRNVKVNTEIVLRSGEPETNSPCAFVHWVVGDAYVIENVFVTSSEANAKMCMHGNKEIVAKLNVASSDDADNDEFGDDEQ